MADLQGMTLEQLAAHIAEQLDSGHREPSTQEKSAFIAQELKRARLSSGGDRLLKDSELIGTFVYDNANETVKFERAASPADKSSVGDRWIRVEDQLPDNHQYVLACSSLYGCFFVQYENHGGTRLFLVKLHPDIDVKEQWLTHVTHWRPIPAPPADTEPGKKGESR